MTGTSAALHATVTASVLVGLPVTIRAVRAPAVEPSPRRAVGPGWWLAAVVGLLLVNQVLFTVYALRVRNGDLSYLGGYVPDGWFELADGPVMTWLADHAPAPGLLAVCALRLPSLLELPFGMLAYLTIVNWLDPRLYRRLTGTTVLALTSASYSITFGLIEWAMHTVYTTQDLVLRAVSAVLTVFAFGRLRRRPSAVPGTGAPRTAAELLAFAASTAALGFLALALYDSVLLYSMGKVGQHVPGAVVAGLVLAASRLAASRLRERGGPLPAGPGLDTLTTGLSWWLALFLIPALAIRYELGFGSRLFAAAAGLLVIGAATTAALFQVYGRLPLAGRAAAVRRWLLGLAVAVLVAVVAAAGGLAVPAVHTELRLLWSAALFVLAATAVTTTWDRQR
ncbi:hypothetical protein [Actinoplanes regularis]|uniref:Uncharacterized protein n=1 Tax=Actinoplanes regularis TaxID=52697 RepID=A0A239DRG4_9ACTN|nr:hypothetical protein [Actinoplanes regularis]GIE89068.1 hypothetical protein Are01nite_55480 [Actinoplanes regularis]SNS34323.1 hypothetical protein SAMN06264365_11432 [Actinoplanes regularis]